MVKIYFLFLFGIVFPTRSICLIADCSESSVLRARTLDPYVPLRRTPSESVFAIRQIGPVGNTIPKREYFFNLNETDKPDL